LNTWYTMEDIANTVRPYKVYTALLTQSGGDDTSNISEGAVTKGVTYVIDGGSDGDFSNVGAPNNDDSTWFVAINNEVPNSYGSTRLKYNTGAPVVTVLENTIGNIWFTYNSIGVYVVNSVGLNDVGLFITNKTTKILGAESATNFYDRTSFIDEINSTASQILICCKAIVGDSNIDDLLVRKTLEIRVYN